MFQQFDTEMRKRGLDTAIVIGESTLGNPELAYVVGAVIPRGGTFVKRIGEDPLLVVSNIDVESARRGRVRDIRTYTDYGYEKLLEQHGRQRGQVMLMDRLLRSVHVQGKIGIYSRNEFSHLLSLTDSLRKVGYRVVGEENGSLIESLRETKDHLEIEKIRNVGIRAAKVVERVLEMFRECRIRSGRLQWRKRPLKVATVRSRINTLLAQYDLIAPEGTIFAVGKSSADPHHMGRPSQPVRERVPIVFDLFPASVEGYWFDLTRTFVIGRAPSKIRRMFQAVSDVQLRSLDMVRENVSGRDIMNAACDCFERKGYRTIRRVLKGDKKAGKTGFIHSLGHGVGLTIGEKPYLSLFSDDILRKGHIVTVEPGLYEPRIGGVRIEDTVLVGSRRVENLTPLTKELEV